jgi:hypothetical protein
MSIQLILDTNVFYDLGDGRLSLSEVRADPTEQVCYSPISPLEIAGKWSSRSFIARRGAAAAILSSGAVELPDTDTLLIRDIFGYTPAFPQFSFAEGVKAMARSATMSELTSGVPDFTRGVVRSVSVAAIGQWRQQVEGDWVKDHIALQASTIPGFTQWYDPDPAQRRGAVPKLKGTKKAEFLNQIHSPEFSAALIGDLQKRALLSVVDDASLSASKAKVGKYLEAITAVACFCGCYKEYFARLMTGGLLPQENDSGDIELFLYSADDDHIVVTSDRKWKSLAEAAGFAQRVRTVPLPNHHSRDGSSG